MVEKAKKIIDTTSKSWGESINLGTSNRENEKLRIAQREMMIRRREAQLHARFDAIHAAFYGRALFVSSSMMCLRGVEQCAF